MTFAWKETAVYFIVGGVFILAVLWPVSLHLTLMLDVGRGEGRVSVRAWPGKAVVETVRTDAGAFDVVIRIRVLHVIPLQFRLLGTEDSGGAYDRADSAKAVPVLDFLWQRWRPLLFSLRRGAIFSLTGLRVRSMTMRAWLGLGDAARTATVYGSLWAALGSAGSWLQRRTHIVDTPALHVWPVYNRWVFRLEGKGVVELPFGHLLRTVGVVLVEYWRETRDEGRKDVAVPSAAENV